MKDLLTCPMSILQGVKEVVIGSKVSRSEADVLQAVCDREDRSMSYVLRELAIRGLAHYFEDGSLKVTDKENEFIRQGRSKVFSEEIPVQGLPISFTVNKGDIKKKKTG